MHSYHILSGSLYAKKKNAWGLIRKSFMLHLHFFCAVYLEKSIMHIFQEKNAILGFIQLAFHCPHREPAILSYIPKGHQ